MHVCVYVYSWLILVSSVLLIPNAQKNQTLNSKSILLFVLPKGIFISEIDSDLTKNLKSISHQALLCAFVKITLFNLSKN